MNDMIISVMMVILVLTMMILCLLINIDVMIIIIAVSDDQKHIIMKLTHHKTYIDDDYSW